MDADQIRRVIEAHSGNLSSCARELSVTRQALTRRLGVIVVVSGENMSLLAYAEQLRAAAGVKGPRPTQDDALVQAERARLIDAVAVAGGYRTAAAALNVSPATIFRRLKRLGVTPADVDRRRSEMSKA